MDCFVAYARGNDVEKSIPVIASQRVGAKRRPMTGSSKQSSFLPVSTKLDCFVASLLAMTAGVPSSPIQFSNSRYSLIRHTPPPGLAFGEPDDRLQRGIQYSGALRQKLTASEYWIVRLRGR
jgi:hypothetical protein